MITFKATLPGLSDAQMDLVKTAKNVKKAPEAAARAVGFKYRKIMKSEIRKGKPGGHKWPKLSVVARRFRKHRNIKGIQPMSHMARKVAYMPSPGRDAGLEIGWLDAGPHATPQGILAYLNKQMAGFTSQVGMADIRHFQQFGRAENKTSWSRGSGRSGARYATTKKGETYVLRKSTKTLTTPARPLIQPFLAGHRQQMIRDFEYVFHEKVRGRYARI